MKALFVILFAMTQIHTSSAAPISQFNDGELDVLQASLDVRDQFVTALQNQDFTAITHSAMGDAVAMLAQDLRDRSDETMAANLENVWTQNESLFFTAQFRDLGDHAPLIPKLEDFFNQLSNKYGSVILSLPIVSDLRTLNFAIPVVFQPRGAWQSKDPSFDNRIEYRKHFIPFANIVTYYGVLIGCNYLAKKEGQGDMKKVCQTAADKLKFAMGRYIAPVISDWIFKQGNKSIVITDANRYYTTAEQLRAAIQNGQE